VDPGVRRVEVGGIGIGIEVRVEVGGIGIEVWVGVGFRVGVGK
jgi:hypothetical protein